MSRFLIFQPESRETPRSCIRKHWRRRSRTDMDLLVSPEWKASVDEDAASTDTDLGVKSPRCSPFVSPSDTFHSASQGPVVVRRTRSCPHVGSFGALSVKGDPAVDERVFQNKMRKRVSFHALEVAITVESYSTIYGCHPKYFEFDSEGRMEPTSEAIVNRVKVCPPRARPTVGCTVRVKATNRCGRIVSDDKTALPYEVIYDDGTLAPGWMSESQLEVLSMGPAAESTPSGDAKIPEVLVRDIFSSRSRPQKTRMKTQSPPRSNGPHCKEQADLYMGVRASRESIASVKSCDEEGVRGVSARVNPASKMIAETPPPQSVARPTVGAKVAMKASGKEGFIITDDKSSLPYQIRYSSGSMHPGWVDCSQFTLVS